MEYKNIRRRFFKNTMYMHIIPLIKSYNFRKRKIHIAVFTGAFCHKRVENLLKGPECTIAIAIKLKINVACNQKNILVFLDFCRLHYCWRQQILTVSIKCFQENCWMYGGKKCWDNPNEIIRKTKKYQWKGEC